jgi:hypothetical protein
MRGLSRFLSIVLLVGLVIPGSALGTGHFSFEGPPYATVGVPFDVKVYLTVDAGGPLETVCGLQYIVSYPSNLAGLTPPDPACSDTDNDCNPGGLFCITLPPVDGGFFESAPRQCVNCTAPFTPNAINCVPPACDPAALTFTVAAQNDGICTKTVPVTHELVSTLTFQATTTGPFSFSKAGPTEVSDCNATPDYDNMTILSPPIRILERPPVPALSSFGIAIFALLVAGSFILLIRRRRKAGLLVLVFCLAVAGGLTFSKAANAQGCPEYCRNGDADVNKNGYVSITDAQIVLNCVKSNCDNKGYDVNRDSVVDMADYIAVMSCIQTGCWKQ